jgi:hypothetical protein
VFVPSVAPTDAHQGDLLARLGALIARLPIAGNLSSMPSRQRRAEDMPPGPIAAPSVGKVTIKAVLGSDRPTPEFPKR